MASYLNFLIYLGQRYPFLFSAQWFTLAIIGPNLTKWGAQKIPLPIQRLGKNLDSASLSLTTPLALPIDLDFWTCQSHVLPSLHLILTLTSLLLLSSV